MPEDGWLAAHVVWAPPSQWPVGKAFRVTDDRLAMVMTGAAPRAGTDIYYAGSAAVPAITGRDDLMLLFTTARGDTLHWRTASDPRLLPMVKRLDVPFTVDLDLVAQADLALRGMQLWTMTRNWGADGEGLLFEAVTVTEVAPGDDVWPLMVKFVTQEGKRRGTFQITPEESQSVPRSRTFPGVFALSDPWRQHPEVDPLNRPLIARGQTAPGMTPEEVRLAVGRPATIKRYGSTSTMLHERWVYDNGRILNFDDGVLAP